MQWRRWELFCCYFLFTLIRHKLTLITSLPVHKENLYKWVGCVSKFYYDYHLAKFDNKKTVLTNKVKAFGSDPLESSQMKEIDRAQLTTFITQFRFRAKRDLFIDKSSVKENPGSDTHFLLVPPPPPLPPPPIVNNNPPTSSSKKRKVGNDNPSQGFQPLHPNVIRAQQIIDGSRAQNSNMQHHHMLLQQQIFQQQPWQYPQHARQHPQQNRNAVPPLVVHNSTDRRVSQEAIAKSIARAESLEAAQGTINEAPARAAMGKVKEEPAGSSSQNPRVAQKETKETEIIDLAGSDDEENDAKETSAPPISSTGAIAGSSNNGDSKANVYVASNNGENNDEQEEDDDASVSSTKEDYKKLCNQLSSKLEERNEADRQTKKENRRLKKEVLQLKQQLEAIHLLPS